MQGDSNPYCCESAGTVPTIINGKQVAGGKQRYLLRAMALHTLLTHVQLPCKCVAMVQSMLDRNQCCCNHRATLCCMSGSTNIHGVGSLHIWCTASYTVTHKLNTAMSAAGLNCTDIGNDPSCNIRKQDFCC